MKVVIPVIDKDAQRYTIADGFSETECICIYDTHDNDVVWLEKRSISQNMSELLPELARNHMTHIITRSVQPMALSVLTRSGFSVFKSVGDNLFLNLELFNRECLPIFNMNAAMLNASSCGGACSTCRSADCKN